MHRYVPLIVLLACGGAACAARPPARTFADLDARVRPGRTLFVIDDSGTETRGRLAVLSADALTLDTVGSPRTFPAARVRQVQRYGESLWNGLLIGSAVGLPGTLLADPPYRACRSDPARLCADTAAAAGQRALGLAMMAGIGAGIDALMRSRNQVYLAPGQPAP